jgi:hypothetical protein
VAAGDGGKAVAVSAGGTVAVALAGVSGNRAHPAMRIEATARMAAGLPALARWHPRGTPRMIPYLRTV